MAHLKIQHNGTIDTLAGWARRTKTPYRTMWARWKRGLSIREVIEGPDKKGEKITHDGKTLTFLEWSRITGVERDTLYHRINRLGWSPERALTTPPNSGEKRYEYQGESLTVRQWSDRTGLPYSIIYQRIKRGQCMKHVLTNPVGKYTRSK